MTCTREKLIEICEKATVKESDWNNRDSADAQRQLGEAWALLKAGCEFFVRTSGNCATDTKTIWIEIESLGFKYFECGSTNSKDSETYYLPTEERLADRAGKDWY